MIKEAIKEAILNGDIPNEEQAARNFMKHYATEELGLTQAGE
jgi:hypothetical protein